MLQVYYLSLRTLWSTAAFDEKSGKTLSYQLKKLKLAPYAFPSQLPNHTSYLPQSISTERSNRDSILQRKKLLVVKAIGESRKDFEDNVFSITDLKQKLKTDAPWQMIVMDAKRTKGVLIIYIKHLDSSSSYFDCSLHIKNDMMQTAYIVCGVRISEKDCHARACEFTPSYYCCLRHYYEYDSFKN